MKPTQYHSFTATFFWLAIFLVHMTSSLDISSSAVDTSGICVLNFTYPYQPSGECIKREAETIKQWGSFRTTRCCRNVLTTMSQALALRASNTQPPAVATIFITQDLWTNCSGPFARQPLVSANSCGFGGFFYGSSTSHCSNLTMQDMNQDNAYQAAVKACNSSYDDFNGVCTTCTVALLSLRDELVSKSGDNSNKKTERAMCAVAAVVSTVVATLNNEDFFRCLLLLDESDPDYFKIKYALAQVLLAIIVAITTIILIIMLVKYVNKRRIVRKAESKEYVTSWSGLYRFSKAEIEKAIGIERKSLGRGSAGHVYKGVLPSGQTVAIKHINMNSESDSFRREVEGLSRIRHPNLVCLFGFCIEDDCHYLVYEYCSGGNLAQQLLKKDTLLTWDKRVKILRDCANALKYLHHFMDGCIVHRDIKLTNILLIETLEPKLSDFGLAKMLKIEESKVFTDVRGTIGYMDPEYMSNAKLTCASDVYSFGIVSLQILSGQKVIELNLDARDQLTRKAKDVSLGNRSLEDFEDPRLKGKVNKDDFKAILQIAVLCVAKSSQDRPSINMVFNEMDKAWKNTNEYKLLEQTKQLSPSTSATAVSPSLEFIPV